MLRVDGGYGVHPCPLAQLLQFKRRGFELSRWVLTAIKIRAKQQLELLRAGLLGQFLQQGPAIALQAAPLGGPHTHREIGFAEKREHAVLLFNFHIQAEGMQLACQLFFELMSALTAIIT